MNYKYEYEVLSDNAIDMIFNGKVSQKNAFDINVDFLSKIPNLIKPNQTEDSSWQKASASLDASAKIYGFRVDAVHSDTFKFLNGLNRNSGKSSYGGTFSFVLNNGTYYGLYMTINVNNGGEVKLSLYKNNVRLFDTDYFSLSAVLANNSGYIYI